jgi:23S rRNA (pseudouridine1915-N3)-methyltransferase
MKVTLLAIGRTDKKYMSDAIEEYVKRLVHYLPFGLKIIPDIKNTKNLTNQLVKEKEGELLKASIKAGDEVILLDENGKHFSSIEFSKFMEKKSAGNVKNLIFIIGGAYGFSTPIYEMATDKISLSKMTFSHQMVRLIFVEQLYRAMTIIKGEPYHHI